MVEAGAVVQHILLSVEPSHDELRQLAARHGIEIIDVTDEVLREVSDLTTPPGAVAVVRLPDSTSFAGGPPSRLLILDRVADPGNVGTLIRTADAVGAGVVSIAGTADPFSPKVVRGTTGSVVRVPLLEVDAEAARERLSAWPHTLVVLDTSGGELYGDRLPYPLALVAGNEAHGPSDWPGERRRIPMRPGVDSLNVAVATAVALYESVRQHGPG